MGKEAFYCHWWWDITKIFIVKAVWENTSFQEDKLIPDIKLCSAAFGNVPLRTLGLFLSLFAVSTNTVSEDLFKL